MEKEEIKEVRYFLHRFTVEFEVDKYPKKYPGFILFTDEDAKFIKARVIQATINGLDLKIRKINFSTNGSDGMFLDKILEKMDEAEEISEELFNLYSEIEHWNPLEDLDRILDEFVRFKQAVEEKNKEELGITEEKIQEFFDEAVEKMQGYHKIFNPDKKGIITKPGFRDD